MGAERGMYEVQTWEREACSEQGRHSAWPVYVVHWQAGKKWNRELGWTQILNGLIDSAQNCRCNCKISELATNSRTKNTMTFS